MACCSRGNATGRASSATPRASTSPLPEDSEKVRRQLLELVEANQAPNCTLRLVIVRNGGGMWAGPSNGRASDVIALTADSKDWGDGVKLAYVRRMRAMPPASSPAPRFSPGR